jgi:hypothetical protein
VKKTCLRHEKIAEKCHFWAKMGQNGAKSQKNCKNHFFILLSIGFLIMPTSYYAQMNKKNWVYGFLKIYFILFFSCLPKKNVPQILPLIEMVTPWPP